MKITHRNIEKSVLRMLDLFPAVYVNGPRQSGKTTLVCELLASKFKADVITFDDLRQRSAAMMSPQSFIENAGYPLIIDEVQMVPDISYALKKTIDEQRLKNLHEGKEKPNGRYLLTGSANLSMIPTIAKAMVGRMGTVTLLPFAAHEYTNGKGAFIKRVFSKDFTHLKKDKDFTVIQAMQSATYPEIIGTDMQTQESWFNDYVRKITLEDPHSIYNLEKAEYMPALLQALAARAGNLINDADLSRDTGLTAKTAHIYRGLLEGSFITKELRPWFQNTTKRLVKAGKQYFYDTLLLSYLHGSIPEQISKHNARLFGNLLENFVFTELLKLIANAGDETKNVRVSFYRTREGKEVDFILEGNNGKFVAIEVKNAERISKKDLSGMKEFQDITGDNFVCGIILCNVEQVLPYGDNIYLVPYNALWE